ncbi:BTB/POZ domain-containing protein At3g56230-like isoform X1 [Gossypium hirsutum]|uniref:BTB/POZ domain-containing protein At3g56230-like isoform X1 n=1 Tax=Gossypium hirsutum TaxID=3635 RepID=A0ABM3BTV3_GOSHI|nr:BTB/POZ domain-containing protein At3g56230-like isoform X1 [Gossypium hirsutum]
MGRSLKMPVEKTPPFLRTLFSSSAVSTCSTFFSDIFSVCCSCFPNISSRVNSSINEAQPQANQTKWIDDLKEKRVSFLSGLFEALKEETHSDALLKPSDGSPSIPAHRVVLATRSEIFKDMLETNCFKNDTIRVPELNSEEIESLLEFLYNGILPLEKLEKHVHPLFIASKKYEIPYLQEFCQCYMLNSLNASNVLDVLETSQACSNTALKEIALDFIFNNAEAVVLSDKYEALAAKNPQLCMQITREFFMNAKNEKFSRARVMGFQKKNRVF